MGDYSDYMWTTETEDEIVREGRARVSPEERETINDDDARTLMLEQMRRRVNEIHARDREREQVREWQERERDLRNRMLRAEYPEPARSVRDRRQTEVERRRETIGFLQDFLDKEPKKKEEKILKPLPDELFELD